METFLEFAKEIFKGVVRAISAHFFQKILRKREKTTAPSQAKGWFSKLIQFDNHHPDGRGCGEEC